MPRQPSIAASTRKQIRAELKEIAALEKQFTREHRRDITKLEREIKRLKKAAAPVLRGIDRRRAILLGRLS
jgi:septin family protein